jgi:hypothetical protein
LATEIELARTLSLIATQSSAYYRKAVEVNDPVNLQWKAIFDVALRGLSDRYCFFQGRPFVDACDLVQDTRPDYPNVFVCRTCLIAWVRTQYEAYPEEWSSADWHGTYPWDEPKK